MFKTEESRIGAVILLTFALLLLAMVFDMYVVIGSTVIFLAIMLLLVFAVLTGKNIGQPKDERTALCSLNATRNGFVTAIVLMTLLTVAAQLKITPLTTVDVLSAAWGLSVMVYMLSYLFYKRIA